MPVTQAFPSGHREDLGLVVETDSLRYHRTAFMQAADYVRDELERAIRELESNSIT